MTDLYEEVLKVFDTVSARVDSLDMTVRDNRAALKSMPSEERMGAVRQELHAELQTVTRETLIRIDEKIGNVREAILSEVWKAHNEAKTQFKTELHAQLQDMLPKFVAQIIHTHKKQRLDDMKQKAKAYGMVFALIIAVTTSIAQCAGVTAGSVNKDVSRSLQKLSD
jgi:hypothetical protein